MKIRRLKRSPLKCMYIYKCILKFMYILSIEENGISISHLKCLTLQSFHKCLSEKVILHNEHYFMAIII